MTNIVASHNPLGIQPYQFDVNSIIYQTIFGNGKIDWKDIAYKIVASSTVEIIRDSIKNIKIDTKYIKSFIILILKLMKMNSLKIKNVLTI